MKTILWDFDGVILDSMAVRDIGFKNIFQKYNEEAVNKLLDYHRKNGGLSRYVKIRYFYESILYKSISVAEIEKYAENFSLLMKKELVNKEYLISETLNFIKKNHTSYDFHIVSGSDQNELRFLCKELKIDSYFITINGSPVPKNKLVEIIMAENGYEIDKTCLIGDSVNDYEAAKMNDIYFYGYNNLDLKKLDSITYLNNFGDFNLIK